MIKTRFIIVGQGIAGTMLALELERRGIEDFLIFENDHATSSSLAAAGTINPVTGRNYVKSWMFEELKAAFIPRYSNVNDLVSYQLLRPLPIIRSLHSVKEENMWLSRMEDEQYRGYMAFQNDITEISEWIQKPQSYGIVQQAWQLQLRHLLPYFHTFWKNKGKLITDSFDHSLMTVHSENIKYKDFEAEKLIFCEGHAVKNNPYFNHLPFDPVKGEALIIHLREGFDQSVRDKIFITPLGDDLYWCGANYEWNFENHLPSSGGYTFVKNQLDQILKRPYEVADHWAGVRPATKSRRPILSNHETFPNLFIFNGLGTKGSSLAPYFAEKMVDMLGV